MTYDPRGWTLTVLQDIWRQGQACQSAACTRWGVALVEDFYGTKTYVCDIHALDYVEDLRKTFESIAAKEKGNEMGTLRWEPAGDGYLCETAGCRDKAPWRLGGFENTVYFCTAHVWELKDLILPAYVVVPDGDSWTVKFRSSSGDLDTIMTTRKLSESDATRIAEILNRGYGE